MTDHANELRRHARKIPHPQGETPGVMLLAADEIERLQRVIASPHSMTRDDVIRMAREAGFRAGRIELYNSDPLPFVAPCSATDCLPEIERFAAIVTAAHEGRFKWYFKQVEPSGTVVARTPDGNEFVVKGGNFDTGAGRELLNAMIATLSGP